MPPKNKSSTANAAAAAAAAASLTNTSHSSSYAANLEFTKKIQPIYDALDSGNLKGALKLLSASMAKYGRRSLLLTLLALVHARLDQHTEASALTQEIAATRPTDPHLLSTLALVHKHLEQPHLIPPLYETALSCYPSTSPPPEELLVALFFSYAALYSYPLAQKTAMKLYTHHKHPHYLFYSLLNNLLPLPPTPSPQPLLLLSERMIRRGCPTPTLRPDDVDIVAEAIRRQGEDKKELEWLEGEGGVMRERDEEEWERRVREVYGRMGNKRRQRDKLEEMMIKHDGDWEYVTQWMESHITRLDWKPTVEEGEVEEDDWTEESRVQHMKEVIERLKSDPNNTGGRQRNPHLASVHLAYLLLLRTLRSTPSPPDSVYDELMSSLVTYYRLYGAKPCFFNDCQSYLITLPPSLRPSLLSQLRDIAGPDYEPSHPVQDGAVRIPLLISYHQCAHFLNVQGGLSTQGLEQLVLVYYHHFLLSSALSAVPPSTSRGAGDPFLVLVCSVLYQLYEKTGVSLYLFTLSVLVEHALSFSPHNFDHSLHLLRVYSHPALSCPARSLSIYQSLSIKQIQHESLSHLILHDLVRLGLLTSAYGQCGAVLSVHSVYGRDEGQVLQLAYEQRRWRKVLEMKEMRERLDRSWGKGWAKVERRWMELVRCHSKELSVVQAVMEKQREEREEEVKDEELIVNSDYSIIPCYDPPSSRLHAQLNRPSPSLLSSFHPFHSPAPINSDHTYPVDTEYLTYLHYKRLVPSLLTSAIQSDAPSLRTHLSTLKSILTSLSLAPFPSLNPTDRDPLPSLPNTFDGLHWWFTFLLIETCACVIECKEPTAVVLKGVELSQAELDDHVLRWSSVQRQLHVLIDMLTGLKPFVSTAALYQPSDEKHEVVVGKPVPRPFDPTLLHHCSLFLHHAALYLTLILQSLTIHIPNRKTHQKKKKKSTPETPSTDDGDEHAVWDVLASTRVSLASLIRVSRGVLEGVGEVMGRLSGVEVEWGPEFGLLQSCAEVVEEVKGGGVREVVDLDTFVSQGIAGCITSWTANGEELSKMVTGYLQALQHMKLKLT